MHKHNTISILVPVFSILIFMGAYFFMEPATTGLVVYSENQSKLVNADVRLSTKESEVIPPNAIVEIQVDDKQAMMTVSQFIQKTGQEYDVRTGSLPEFDFHGKGFTGDHTYTLTLADFDIDRKIGKGEHKFITRITYRNKVLYEKENNIMISE